MIYSDTLQLGDKLNVNLVTHLLMDKGLGHGTWGSLGEGGSFSLTSALVRRPNRDLDAVGERKPAIRPQPLGEIVIKI